MDGGWIGQRDQSHDGVVRRGVTEAEFTRYVKSTYRVPLTRGVRGRRTRDFFLSRTEGLFAAPQQWPPSRPGNSDTMSNGIDPDPFQAQRHHRRPAGAWAPMNNPPPSLDDPDELRRPAFGPEYREWLWDAHGVAIGPDVVDEYETKQGALDREFRDSAFWRALPRRLESIGANYRVRRGVPLQVSPGISPDIDTKSWDSFFEKTYRINILSSWPHRPSRGWVLPDTWFVQIGDVVRTKFVVKYLDGLALVANEIQLVAQEHGLRSTAGRLAKAEGYYATHVDVFFPLMISNGIDFETLEAPVEIQVTTELQNNVYDLAHRLYESKRMSEEVSEGDWQWDYQSDEFASNYLGHVLHYLEGMIMRIREGFDDRSA